MGGERRSDVFKGPSTRGGEFSVGRQWTEPPVDIIANEQVPEIAER